MIETVFITCSYFTSFNVDIRDFTVIKTIIVVLLPALAGLIATPISDELHRPQQLG
jgi:hypothetical protein